MFIQREILFPIFLHKIKKTVTFVYFRREFGSKNSLKLDLSISNNTHDFLVHCEKHWKSILKVIQFEKHHFLQQKLPNCLLFLRPFPDSNSHSWPLVPKIISVHWFYLVHFNQSYQDSRDLMKMDRHFEIFQHFEKIFVITQWNKFCSAITRLLLLKKIMTK